MPIHPPPLQPTRTHVARFYRTVGATTTALFKVYKTKGFRGPLEYELNYRNILLPFGGSLLSGNGVPIQKDLEIDFDVHVGNIEIEVVGLELSSRLASSLNNIDYLLAQCNFIEYQQKKYRGLVFQKATPADANSSAKSTVLTAKFLTDRNFVVPPVEWETGETLPVATVMTNYTTQVLASTDAIGAINYTKVSGYAPITVSTTGLITWNYVYTVYDQVITIKATDSNGNATDRTFTIPTQGGLYPDFWPDQYPLE